MRYLIVFFLLWSAVSEFFASKISALNFVDEAIVLVFLLHLLIDVIANARKQRKEEVSFSLFPILIGALVIWTTGSFFVNGSSFSQYFKFLLSISKGFIVFYWIKKFVTEKRILHEVITIIKWLILIQVPFFIIGLLVQRTGYFGDNAVGAIITGDASEVGTFFWFGIFICLGKFDSTKNRRYLFYAVGLAALLIITSTKQLTVLLPLVLLYLYVRRIKVFNFKIVAFIIAGCVAAVMLYNMVEKSWMSNNYGVDTSEANLLDYVDESEKLLGYYSLLYELPDEIKHPLMWGAGPGMYGSYVAMNARAPLSQKYIMSYYDLIPEGLGGTLAYRSSSIIGFWGDIGLIGLLLILLIYIYRTFRSAKKMRTVADPAFYNLTIASGFLLLAQSFVLNVFEGNTFSLNLFWILCGISAAHFFEQPEKPTTEA